MSTPVTYRDLLMDRYRLVYDWVPDGVEKLLDVGCGNALFTQWLRAKAKTVYAVDHNPRNCRRGRAQYPELRLAGSAAEHLPFADATFDCVVCSDTIEHTNDDQASIDELVRVLKPGGMLVLTMPQGGLFGFLDGENLVNGAFEFVRRLRIPKRGGGTLLSKFVFRPHHHYNLDKSLRMLNNRIEISQIQRGGLFLYPFLYLIEKCVECFLGRDLVTADYRAMRKLRAWDFTLPFGPLAFNIALRGRKRGGQ